MFITTFLLTSALGLAITAMPIAPSTTPEAAPEALPAVEDTPAAAEPIPVREARILPVRTYRVPVTAYSSTPDQTDSTPFITADGSHVADGIVAANFLPFGTRVRFPELYGDKVFEVHDRMNRRYPFRADIWMGTRRAAVAFGLKRNVLMEVLPEETKLALAE